MVAALLRALLVAATRASVDPFAGLLRWLRDDCGAVLAPDIMQVAKSPRDIITLTKMSAHDVIARIPRKCILFSDPGAAAAYGEGVDEHALMALHMMQARADKAHFFQPYFRTLPTDLGNFPAYWNESQLAMLPPRARTALTNNLQQWREMWESSLGERFAFDDFKVALTLVTSRVFSVAVGGRRTLAMVPLVDLLNHAWNPTVNSEWSWQDHAVSLPTHANSERVIMGNPDGHFRLLTSAAVGAGERLYMSYGRMLTQQILLVNYGFTLPCGHGFTLPCGRGRGNEMTVDVHQCIDELAYTLLNPAGREIRSTLRRPLVGATFAAAMAGSAMRKSVRRARGIAHARSGNKMPSPQSVRELMVRVLASRSVGSASAGQPLDGAELNSVEFNALNLLVGERSVAEAWIELSLEAEGGAQSPTSAPTYVQSPRR